MNGDLKHRGVFIPVVGKRAEAIKDLGFKDPGFFIPLGDRWPMPEINGWIMDGRHRSILFKGNRAVVQMRVKGKASIEAC